MSIKNFIKPSLVKILLFLIITISSLYFTRENACGISPFFAFCYKAYGFPLPYLVTGSVDSAFGHIKTLPLGEFFSKSGNFLFNVPAFVSDMILIYLLACSISALFKKIKLKH